MWLVYAFLTILGYVGMDLFVKRASGKIDDFLGGAIINFFALLPALLIYFLLKISGKEILMTRNGIIYSITAGIFIGIGTITFIKMFATGTNLSLGTPLVRIGTVILATLVGVMVLRESLTIRQVLGLAISVIGLVLVVFK